MANSAWTSCLACSPSLRTCAGLLCWARASARAAVAARLACAAAGRGSALNWSWICPTASLRKVPGPKTTLAGLRRAPAARTARPCRRAAPGPSGALPERQPSRPSTRRMSEVSTSCVTGSRTSTKTASSPKRWCRRSVAAKLGAPAADERVGRRARLQAQRERRRRPRASSPTASPTSERPPSGGPHDRPQQTRQPHLDRQGTRGGRRQVLVARRRPAVTSAARRPSLL